MSKNFYYNTSVLYVLKKLHTKRSGLTQVQAEKRLKKFGENKLPKAKKLSLVRLFFSQFKNPLVFILFFALALSVVVGHYTDAIIIGAVVIVTNFVGFLQEKKANQSLASLQGLIVRQARVIRQGRLHIVPESLVVPGDIIQLQVGQMIPADARLIQAKDLSVSESALTGEAMPVKKNIKTVALDTALADRCNMVHQGTVIAEGSGLAVVTATGAQTEIGHIAKLLRETKESVTPLQKQINKFGVKLGIFLVVANIIIFFIGILTGRPVMEMLMVAVVIVVSAVPEGLIPAMSIILALGMQRLSKQKGLVRKMVAAETLGSVSVICTDKTGTLTTGKMTVDRIVTSTCRHLFDPEKLMKHQTEVDPSCLLSLKIGVLCNDAVVVNPDSKLDDWQIVGNITEKALIKAGGQLDFHRVGLELEHNRLSVLPFNSKRKLMATLHQVDKERVIYLKGAPERILSRCTKYLHQGQEQKLSASELKKWHSKLNKLARGGQRVIAMAYQPVAKDYKEIKLAELDNLVLVGLIALKDRIRPDAKETIATCRQAGIKVMMVTGDHQQTALAIAQELGLPCKEINSMTGQDIDSLSKAKLRQAVKRISVFARVEPQHKLKIIEALQDNEEVVAMTGDGINDAPALKKADIGVALGSGTDIAKQVADLVLLDDSFKTIVSAVRQGRTTFANIRKVIVYLFSDCFQEMIIIGVAIIFGWPLPMLPAQILWIKLVEDPLPATSLSFEPAEKDVMKDKPRSKHEPLLSKGLNKLIAFYVIIMDTIVLALFYWLWQSGNDLVYVRTVIFLALGIGTLTYIFAIRNLKQSVFKANPWRNKYLTASVGIGVVLFILAIYNPLLNKWLSTTPVGWQEWLLVIVYGFVSLSVFELGKKVTKFKL